MSSAGNAGCLFFPNVLATLETGLKNVKESKLYETARPESASQIYEIMTTTLTVPAKILGFEVGETLPEERIPSVMKMIYEKLLPVMSNVEDTMKDILAKVEKKPTENVDEKAVITAIDEVDEYTRRPTNKYKPHICVV